MEKKNKFWNKDRITTAVLAVLFVGIPFCIAIRGFLLMAPRPPEASVQAYSVHPHLPLGYREVCAENGTQYGFVGANFGSNSLPEKEMHCTLVKETNPLVDETEQTVTYRRLFSFNCSFVNRDGKNSSALFSECDAYSHSYTQDGVDEIRYASCFTDLVVPGNQVAFTKFTGCLKYTVERETGVGAR